MVNINIGNTTRSKPMSNIVACLVKVIRNQLQTDNFVTHSIVTPWYTNFFVDTKPLQWLGIHLSCQLYRLIDIIPMYLKLHTSQVCFCHRTFFDNTSLDSLLRNSRLPCLHSQPVHSADAFHALWLIVYAVLASIEKPYAYPLYIQSCYVCLTLAIYMLNHTI